MSDTWVVFICYLFPISFNSFLIYIRLDFLCIRISLKFKILLSNQVGIATNIPQCKQILCAKQCGVGERQKKKWSFTISEHNDSNHQGGKLIAHFFCFILILHFIQDVRWKWANFATFWCNQRLEKFNLRLLILVDYIASVFGCFFLFQSLMRFKILKENFFWYERDKKLKKFCVRKMLLLPSVAFCEIEINSRRAYSDYEHILRVANQKKAKESSPICNHNGYGKAVEIFQLDNISWGWIGHLFFFIYFIQ